MVYSAVRERDRNRPKRPEQAVGALVSTRAVVSLSDRRYVLDGPRATIGRSKSVECVLAGGVYGSRCHPVIVWRLR